MLLRSAEQGLSLANDLFSRHSPGGAIDAAMDISHILSQDARGSLELSLELSLRGREEELIEGESMAGRAALQRVSVSPKQMEERSSVHSSMVGLKLTSFLVSPWSRSVTMMIRLSGNLRCHPSFFR